MFQKTQPRFFTPFLFIVIIIFASCNGNNSAPATTDTLTSTSSSKTQAVSNIQSFYPIFLDTLWVEAATFANVHQKLAFRFYFDTSGSILMNGWNTNGNGPYSPSATLMLHKGKRSLTAQYHAGDYLGNLLLSSNDINAIQKIAKDNHALYILFAPIDPATAQYPGQVTYNILVTSDDPNPLVKIPKPTFVPTGINTNPSPPGTAN